MRAVSAAVVGALPPAAAPTASRSAIADVGRFCARCRQRAAKLDVELRGHVDELDERPR